MATHTVIRDVGTSLKSLILANIAELVGDTSISFESPADLTVGATAQLSLFLARISHNEALRNIPESYSGVSSRENAPLYADLSYLMTPLCSEKSTEYAIMEQLMQLFHDNPVLEGAQLEGNLVAEGNEELRVIPLDLPLEEINKLWGMFPNKSYHPGVNFLVSPVRIPSTVVTSVTRVTNASIELSLSE